MRDSIESTVLDSMLSRLTIHLIQKFYININYFIIRDILIIIYLFYNLQKKQIVKHGTQK